eukprot:gene32358-3550_t
MELPRAQIDDVAEEVGSLGVGRHVAGEGLSTESAESSCGGMKAQLATCFNLASLLASSGKLQEAGQFVEKAMQIDPTSQETRLLAGAGQAMEEAMRIDPTYQKTCTPALWVGLLSGDRDKGAGQAMEEAMRIDPTYQKTGPSALWVELLSGY